MCIWQMFDYDRKRCEERLTRSLTFKGQAGCKWAMDWKAVRTGCVGALTFLLCIFPQFPQT